MEVSKRKTQAQSSDMHSNLKLANSSHAEDLQAPTLEGEDLLQTLVTLTGLPEKMANQEIDQILDLSGHEKTDRENLTLEELRAAMIAYLEALQLSENEQDAPRQ